MNLIFCLWINVKDFFNLILSFKVCVARHAQINQIYKFVVSLQYLKKKLSEVDFLHPDKHESFLQIDCDLLQDKGPSSFAFPTAFRCFQLSLTAFQKFDTKISY